MGWWHEFDWTEPNPHARHERGGREQRGREQRRREFRHILPSRHRKVEVAGLGWLGWGEHRK